MCGGRMAPSWTKNHIDIFTILNEGTQYTHINSRIVKFEFRDLDLV
jgi:hypothetical protein